MRTIKGKVKEIIRHGQHYNLPDVVERLNPILRGWEITSNQVIPKNVLNK